MARKADFKGGGKKSPIRVDKPEPDPVPPEVAGLAPEMLWNAIGDLIRHLYWEFERYEMLRDLEGFLLVLNGLREVVRAGGVLILARTYLSHP